jgi:hypothetical protein
MYYVLLMHFYRYYTSVNVFLHLAKMGIHAFGTILTNKKGYPPQAVMTEAEGQGLGKHSLKVFEHATPEGLPKLIATTWFDTKPVHFLSIGIGTALAHVPRRQPGSFERAQAPTTRGIMLYGKYMGGVDLADLLRMSKFSVQASLYKNKWYLSIFFGLFDMAVTNMYIVWKALHSDKKDPLYKDHYTFIVNLVDEICALPDREEFRSLRRTSSSKAKRQRVGSYEFDALFSPTKGSALHSFPGHRMAPIQPKEDKTRKSRNRADVDEDGFIVKYGYAGKDKRYAVCVVCKRNGKPRYTETYCPRCQVPVCVKLRTGDDPSTGIVCWNSLHSDAIFEKIQTKGEASCDFSMV